MAQKLRRQIEVLTQSVSDRVRDRALRHSIQIDRFVASETRDIVRLLNRELLPDVIRELKKRLARITQRGFELGPASTKRLREMTASINELIRGGIRNASVALKSELREFVIMEAEWHKRILQAEFNPLGIDLVTPNPAQLRAIITAQPMQGKLLSEWWTTVKTYAQRGISQQINLGITQGETIRQITKRVLGTAAEAFGDGTFASVRRNAQTVVRTAIRHVNTQAREAVYAANSDVIKKVQWVSTLDAKTTDICMSLDGRTFDIHEGPRPPIHMNCRSDIVPVVKSLEEMGLPARKIKALPERTRTSFTGRVPRKITYNDWLKRMDANPGTKNIVDEALGPGRAKLWRQGKISVRDLVDQQHRPLTLEQLREKFDAA